MELRHLRYFVAVAEELSFRKAAEKLNMAQPPLSAQIKSLEEELRVRLFDRTTRSVQLTHSGRVLLADARAVIAACSLAEQRVRDAEHALVGILRVGVIAPVTNAFLAECAKAGAKPRPVQYANDIQTKMWLISAGFGIAPTIATFEEVRRPGLTFRPLPSALPLVQTVLVWRRDDSSPVLSRFCGSFEPFGKR